MVVSEAAGIFGVGETHLENTERETVVQSEPLVHLWLLVPDSNGFVFARLHVMAVEEIELCWIALDVARAIIGACPAERLACGACVHTAPAILLIRLAEEHV